MILTPCRLYIACTVLFSLKITYRKRRNYDEEVFLRRYANAALERLRVRVPAADLSERQTNPFDGQPEQAGTDAVHTVYRSTSSRTAHGRFYFPGQGDEVMGITLREPGEQYSRFLFHALQELLREHCVPTFRLRRILAKEPGAGLQFCRHTHQ